MEFKREIRIAIGLGDNPQMTSAKCWEFSQPFVRISWHLLPVLFMSRVTQWETLFISKLGQLFRTPAVRWRGIILIIFLPEFLAGHALLEVERALSHLLRDAVAHLHVVRLVAADQPLGHCNKRDTSYHKYFVAKLSSN